MKKISGRYILVLIAMCGLIATSVGLITNIAGLFFTPVSEELGVLKGSVSMTLTISNLAFALGGVIAPKLFSEKSLKKVLIAGTAIIAGCTAALGLSANLVMMYILNALRGFAGGILGFVLVTTVINNWFTASVGLATSIAMSCSGLAGALFSPIISTVIESGGWRTGYFAAAVMMALLNLPAILFLPSLRPQAKGLLPYGYEEAGEAQKEETVTQTSASKVSGVMFVIAIIYAFLACGATALPQHFPGIAGSYGMAASVGALMLSICMIANSLGKVVLGAMADKIGTKPALLIYSALTIGATLILWFIHTPFTMYIGACLFGLTYALGTVAVVLLTKDMFGLENYGRTYPTISLSGTIANALFSSLIGFMYDFSGNYTATLLLMLAMLGINTFIIITAYRQKT